MEPTFHFLKYSRWFFHICWVCPSLFPLPTHRVKILVAEFREMFPGDHAKPSTEALSDYDGHIDRGDDYVADDDDGDHEYVGGVND